MIATAYAVCCFQEARKPALAASVMSLVPTRYQQLSLLIFIFATIISMSANETF
jgi:hypothetical protein